MLEGRDWFKRNYAFDEMLMIVYQFSDFDYHDFRWGLVCIRPGHSFMIR